jgi:hypothetical protein
MASADNCVPLKSLISARVTACKNIRHVLSINNSWPSYPPISTKAFIRNWSSSDPESNFYQDEDIVNTIKHLFQTLMPTNILHTTKKYLHCKCHKPINMKVHNFFNFMNNIMVNELPHLPPFTHNQTLTQDKVINILLFATPSSWQVHMESQNWDPLIHNIHEIVDFMECIENSEEFNCKPASSKPNNNGKKHNNNKKSKHSKDTHSHNDDDGKKEFYCKVHGKNYTHDMSQCCVANKFKAEGKPIEPQSMNKMWSCKANDNKTKATKELNALIKSLANHHVAHALSKKRGKSDDSDNEEANIIEDLASFNYKDIANITKKLSSLNTNSDDEISI